MPKLSFMKFEPSAWLNDTRELSPEAKAAWIDMLCLMWNAPERGVWIGTYQEFARATGLPWEIAPAVVTELGRKTSRVTIRNTEVTLENRRMVNQESHYKNHANRQKVYRQKQASDKKVTDKTLDVVKTLDVIKTTPNTYVHEFENIWNQYPKRLGRKQAEKHFRTSVKTDADLKAINSALQNYKQYIRDKKIEEQFIKMGSTWFNNWQDWTNYSGGNNGTNGDEGISYYAALAKRAREAAGIREPIAPPRALSAGVRDLPDVQRPAEISNGAGEHNYVAAMEILRSGGLKIKPT